MKYALAISAFLLASVMSGAASVSAQQIDLSLNLLYSDPTDELSGGDWELVARAPDSEGIAGFSAQLTDTMDPEFHTPQGAVDGMVVGFADNVAVDFGSHTELTGAQIPNNPNLSQTLFYDVGVIGGGTTPGENGTPSFTFDEGTERSIPWGRPDTLDNAAWDGAVLLANGIFGPGTTPAFFSDMDDDHRGVVYTTVGDELTAGTVAEASITTIVRDNLMTMTGLMGDYNNNGTVEQADLSLVLLNWGADGTTPPMDWVHDLPSGTIDQEELNGVLLNWGNSSAGGLGGPQSVPEPSTLLLLASAGWALALAHKVGLVG